LPKRETKKGYFFTETLPITTPFKLGVAEGTIVKEGKEVQSRLQRAYQIKNQADQETSLEKKLELMKEAYKILRTPQK
jgi:hypothetical protein